MVLRPITDSRCEHGGAFWSVLGDRFDRLGAAGEIVAADVLDAWFPPAPSVIDAVREHLPLLLGMDTLPLSRERSYDVDLGELAGRLQDGYDVVVLVNPNSPTGRHVPRHRLECVLREAPAETTVWIDETYVDYVDPEQSLERSVVELPNVVVCKSMSKVYALSGARVAYLCARRELLAGLRAMTPPWTVGLPAQGAAVAALAEPDYYASRHAETRVLREQLESRLRELAAEVVPGAANFLLCHLPPGGPTATEVCERCRAEGVFLRDMSGLSALLGRHAIRVAVRDGDSNRRVVDALAAALNAS